MSESVSLRVREIVFLIFVAVALYLFISLFSFKLEDAGWTHTALHQPVQNFGGSVGAWLADFLLSFLGISAYLLPAMILYHGWVLYRNNGNSHRWQLMRQWLGLGMSMLLSAALLYLHFWTIGGELPNSAGGIFGMELGNSLARSFGMIGSGILLLTAMLVSLTLLTGVYWLGLIDWVGQRCYTAWTAIKTAILGVGSTQSEGDLDVISEASLQQTDPPDFLNELSAISTPNEPEIEDGDVEQVEQDRFSASLGALIDDVSEVESYRDEVLDFDDDSDLSSSSKPQRSIQEPIAPQPQPSLLPVSQAIPAAELSEEIDGLAALSAQHRPLTTESDWASVTADKNAPEPKIEHHAVMRPAKKIPEPERASRKLLPAGTLPPLDALDQHRQRVQGYSKHQLESMADKVEQILKEFGVKAEVKEVHPGPVITRFELDLAPGTKASKVTNLSRDLARALSVQSVRVVEVIPGKPLIGLEIPNNEREMVTLREVLGTKDYQQAESKLTMALGQSISGKPVVADLAKMPHLLVAGTTGSGKSVAVNAMILSLLYKATPEEVRMIMVDPKMLELSVYEDIPHLLTPVVTDMKLASQALRWCVAEMERRYQLMSMMGVRNLGGFNQKITDAIAAGQAIKDPFFQPIEGLSEPADAPDLTTLPQIVIVIDELADMMMIVGKKVEELIARLAQKARAAGLHLILATQRPSVDVLTGLIKANVPTRIGFQVSSKIDSRTILDQSGAEALLGNGDMLYLPPGTSLPQRAHGAFVSDQEVHRVVEFLKRTGGPQYIKSILDPEVGEGGYDGGFSDGGSESDELYDQAVYFVTQSRKASISSVQRKFKIGYNRAATIVEEMENSGVVSPPETNGSRQVLAPPPV